VVEVTFAARCLAFHPIELALNHFFSSLSASRFRVFTSRCSALGFLSWKGIESAKIALYFFDL
jgi:hypothetical protein